MLPTCYRVAFQSIDEKFNEELDDQRRLQRFLDELKAFCALSSYKVFKSFYTQLTFKVF